MTLLIAQPAECALDQSGQLMCCAVDGLVQGRGPMSDCDGLAALRGELPSCTHVAIAALLGAVLIAQVDSARVM